MLVYLWAGCAWTIVRAATLRKKLQIKLSTSPTHNILTPGRQSKSCPYNTRRLAGWPLECQFLRHWYYSTEKKFPRRKRESNPGSAALDTYAPLGQRGCSVQITTRLALEGTREKPLITDLQEGGWLNHKRIPWSVRKAGGKPWVAVCRQKPGQGTSAGLVASPWTWSVHLLSFSAAAATAALFCFG